MATGGATGPLLEEVGCLNVSAVGDHVWYLEWPVGETNSVFRMMKWRASPPKLSSERWL